MSALPPKADIAERNWDVRFVPEADSCTAAKRRKLLLQVIANFRQEVGVGRKAPFWLDDDRFRVVVD
jgi:hypothetical protein